MARRNRLLQQGTHDVAQVAKLQPWNEQLATVGMELLGRRRKAVAALQTEIARVYAALSGARTKVEVRYRTSLGEATEPAALLAALEHRQREEIVIGFNSRYLLEAMGALEKDKVVFEIKDAQSPGVIKSVEDEGYCCVIMPMRI